MGSGTAMNGFNVLCALFLPGIYGIVIDYKLNLTSSAPAVFGTRITFDAQLVSNTGDAPKDPKLFKYQWRRLGSLDVTTTYDNLNSTISKCYGIYSLGVSPGRYEMEVVVLHNNGESRRFNEVAKKTMKFDITSTLNGHILSTQNTSFHGHLSKNGTFSTQQEVNFDLMMKDIFDQQPSLTYEWFINNQPLVGQNTPNLIRNITKTGKYNVTVIARVNQAGLHDCEGFNYTNLLNGTITTEIDLKDPVSDEVVFGSKSAHLGSHISVLLVWMKGSGPFNITWTVRSVNSSDILHNSTHVGNTMSANITLGPDVLTEQGHYIVNVTIENPVSIVDKTINLTVKSHNPPEHSPVYVVLGAVSGLVGITLFLLIFLKVRAYRQRHVHVETADFDFHPYLQSHSQSEATIRRRQSVSNWFKSATEKVKSLINRNTGNQSFQTGSSNRNDVSDPRPTTRVLRTYGSMGDSI